jgi:uncharacterized spore protein YtfJ
MFSTYDSVSVTATLSLMVSVGLIAFALSPATRKGVALIVSNGITSLSAGKGVAINEYVNRGISGGGGGGTGSSISPTAFAP